MYTMHKYFLTFANANYMNTDRVANQVKELNVFTHILQLNETHISEYIEKHSKFIKSNSPGYGRWIWKPKIILDTLSRMTDDDIVVYSDAGMHVNINGKDRLLEYFDKLQTKDVVVFSTNYEYKAISFVKNDAIMSYYPEFHDFNNNVCYAGLIIIKKTQQSLALISDWLELCENYHFIDKSPSISYKEHAKFVGQDADNGLFNLCICKHRNIVETITPDEINVYIGELQAHHALNAKYTVRDIDWSALNDKPFHCKRITPKFA
jgi:hypothetical protein